MYRQSFFALLSSFLFFFILTGHFSCKQPGRGSAFGPPPDTLTSEPVYLDLDQIRERGTLTALIGNSSVSYFLYKGQPMGYEYELLERMTAFLGLKLEVKVVTNFEEAFRMLNRGEGDIMVHMLTVTRERKKRVAFAEPLFHTRQVLVQRKPEGWLKMTRDEIDQRLVRAQIDLAGKEVYVRKSSSYVERLRHLSDEIGGDIIIVEEDDETEAFIRRLSKGEFEFTVADESIAKVNAAYYPNIDINTPISFPQQIAWAVRKNSPKLLEAINQWIAKAKRKPLHNVLFKKYFENPRRSVARMRSGFSSLQGQKLSVYDPMIREAAQTLDWDWLLLASLVYQESRFDFRAKSWAGAVGLMQLMPATAKRFGADNLYDPQQSIAAGAKYLHHLDSLWAKSIDDPQERVKFVLASYNVGLGHVADARNLARKYGRNPLKWDNSVEFYLLMKSKPRYFNDPLVKSGYCRGEEPVKYVEEILNRYDQYRQLVGV